MTRHSDRLAPTGPVENKARAPEATHRPEPVSPQGSGLAALQSLAGNRAVTRLLTLQRAPDSTAGAAQRAREIDAQVQANPTMPVAELQRLMTERDKLLPLIDSPPKVPAVAGTMTDAPRLDADARWAPVDLAGLPDAVPLAAGVTMIPIGTGPPPVPPSVLFPELFATAAEATTVVEVGAAVETAVTAGAAVEAAVGTAATSSTIPVAGWVVAGVIIVGVVGYLVYRYYQTTVPAPVHAPGAPGGRPVSAPGIPGAGPVSAPGVPGAGPVSAPGATVGAPVSAPGAPNSGELVLASRLPKNRTDFVGPNARADALRRAEQLARSIVNGTLELLESSDIFGTPQEAGHVTYYRIVGSTAHLAGAQPRGNIVAIVEHTADPSQPPHFHVVRPPITGNRIEHGGVYYEPFAGTKDQHLTYWPAGTAPPR